MCTLTWWREQECYGVYFNRDEKKDRPVADPPREMTSRAVRFLTPRDPRGNGTWMLANEHGVIVCLLNKWHLGESGTMSRGLLVMSLAGVKTADVLSARMQKANLSDYSPFILFAIDQDGEKLWEWDGNELLEATPVQPLTSSSYYYEEVRQAREECYASGLRGASFHEAENQDASAFTVRMCRPDAQTWSRSVVTVGEDIEWEYLAEQADLLGEPERSVVKLARC